MFTPHRRYIASQQRPTPATLRAHHCVCVNTLSSWVFCLWDNLNIIFLHPLRSQMSADYLSACIQSRYFNFIDIKCLELHLEVSQVYLDMSFFYILKIPYIKKTITIFQNNNVHTKTHLLSQWCVLFYLYWYSKRFTLLFIHLFTHMWQRWDLSHSRTTVFIYQAEFGTHFKVERLEHVNYLFYFSVNCQNHTFLLTVTTRWQ